MKTYKTSSRSTQKPVVGDVNPATVDTENLVVENWFGERAANRESEESFEEFEGVSFDTDSRGEGAAGIDMGWDGDDAIRGGCGKKTTENHIG